MLVESAFSMLPEVVLGLGFQRVRREANAVGSFAFSLLNALHSKNVLDPIQRLQLEKNYGSRVATLPANGANRQCDIFLDYGGSKIGSKALANYGWRYHNYVEAKFLRSYRRTAAGHDTRASANSAEVVADLIRLAALVPEPQAVQNAANAKTASARYFLCLSDHPPHIFINQYLTALRDTFFNPPKTCRIDIDLTTGRSSKAFAQKVGTGFNSMRLELSQATCFAHYPLDANTPSAMWMLLIRLDAFSIYMEDNGVTRSFSVSADRTIHQAAAGDYNLIRNFIAVNLK